MLHKLLQSSVCLAAKQEIRLQSFYIGFTVSTGCLGQNRHAAELACETEPRAPFSFQPVHKQTEVLNKDRGPERLSQNEPAI